MHEAFLIQEIVDSIQYDNSVNVLFSQPVTSKIVGYALFQNPDFLVSSTLHDDLLKKVFAIYKLTNGKLKDASLVNIETFKMFVILDNRKHTLTIASDGILSIVFLLDGECHNNLFDCMLIQVRKVLNTIRSQGLSEQICSVSKDPNHNPYILDPEGLVKKDLHKNEKVESTAIEDRKIKTSFLK
jgi:hypothetical protein